MLIKKIFNYFCGALLFFIAFFAIVQQQRKQYTCFFYAVKREGSKQAVVQLKLDTNQIFKLLQAPCRLVIHVE